MGCPHPWAAGVVRYRDWPEAFRPWLPRPVVVAATSEGCITCGAPCQPGRYFCRLDEPTYVKAAS